MLPAVTDDDHETWDPRLLDRLPDVRDGLTRLERVILWQLHVTQRERNDRTTRVLVPEGSNGSARSARTEETGADEPNDRNVPTAMLYGRVAEHVNVSVEEFQRTLQRLVGVR